jgi:hypothetical protein
MSLKTTMFQEIPFNSFKGELLKIYTLICKIHTLICKSWIGPGPAGHNFERGPPKDHRDQVWF